MNKNSNAIDRIFAAFTNYSGVRNLRRWLMALTLCALCASPVLAYFPGQSTYHFRLYQGGYDSREYMDTNALCTVAVASYAPGNGDALQDIAEVFIQRGKELDGVLDNRWEHYWELLAGNHASGDSLTGRFLNGLGNGGAALGKLFDATFNGLLGQMFSGYSQMLSGPPYRHRRRRATKKIRGLADEDYSFVLIAHSQGNLFVNSAYDGLRSSHPNTKGSVIHVSPASPTLRGEHLLADIDLVINGLRVRASTPYRRPFRGSTNRRARRHEPEQSWPSLCLQKSGRPS